MREALAYQLGLIALFFFRAAVRLSQWLDPDMMSNTILTMAKKIRADNKVYRRQQKYNKAVKK